MNNNNVDTNFYLPIGSYGDFGFVSYNMLLNIRNLQQENSQLKEKIEKAIEIINQMIFNGYAKGGTIYMATSEKSEFGSRAKIILEILKGDKE